MSAVPAPPLSPAAEDHLKAILHLERGEGEPRRAGTSAPAGLLGVTPASACTMLARLARLGLVDHRPRRGARLTVAGRCVAEAVVERGRVVLRLGPTAPQRAVALHHRPPWAGGRSPPGLVRDRRAPPGDRARPSLSRPRAPGVDADQAPDSRAARSYGWTHTLIAPERAGRHESTCAPPGAGGRRPSGGRPSRMPGLEALTGQPRREAPAPRSGDGGSTTERTDRKDPGGQGLRALRAAPHGGTEPPRPRLRERRAPPGRS
jgi:iron dependent repressor-like protein